MRYKTSVVLFVYLSIMALPASAPLQARQAPPPGSATSGAVPSLSQYFDAEKGIELDQLIQLALSRNADLLATRQRTLEAQGLLRQAGFRPNPVLETEFSTGSRTGSPGEREFSIGYAHAFELGGKRGRRMDLGQAGLDLVRLEVSDRERTLRAELQSATSPRWQRSGISRLSPNTLRSPNRVTR